MEAQLSIFFVNFPSNSKYVYYEMGQWIAGVSRKLALRVR